MLVALLALVVVAVAGVAAAAVHQKRGYARRNEVVPGRPTAAPADWAGAHTPEARLHRRLRDAVASSRTVPGLGDASGIDARAAVEQQALALDERLVAAAALAPGHREPAIAALEPEVAALEAAVAALATGTPLAAPPPGELGTAVAEAQERIELLAEARAELEREEERRTGGTSPG